MCDALLECRLCHDVQLMELSIMEHEVLGNSGLLVKQCAACKRATSWSYKDPSVDMTKEDPVEAPLRTENLSARPPV